MTLPLEPPLSPMLARLEDALPSGSSWRYEPKWDGFRALVFRERERLELVSRSGQGLERYFPELVSLLKSALPARCVLDGELIIERPSGLDFDALLQRIHPAPTRVRKLARETPASFVAFDLLAVGDESFLDKPFDQRRRELERLVPGDARLFVTPQTADEEVARRWFVQFEAAGLDGIVAKRSDLPYAPGERTMVKVKHERTVDCVIGGFRRTKDETGVASLLLGLYDGEGRLRYVGFASAFRAAERRELLFRLQPLEGARSFDPAFAPGGPSRWTRGRSSEWSAVAPRIVCEVAFDRLQGERFRHVATFLRFRPDKPPQACTFDQIGRRSMSLQQAGLRLELHPK